MKAISLETPRESELENEGGAVIIFVAITLIVMITFAIWVIDGSLAANSKEQAQQSARLACLAALEAHVDSNNPAMRRKVDAALERARGVSWTSLMISSKKDVSDAANRTQIKSPVAPAGTEGARIEPGLFFFDFDRVDAAGTPIAPQNPCATGESPPCFRGVNIPAVVDVNGVQEADGDGFTDSNNLDRDTINAYRIAGPYYQGIFHKLANIIGQSQIAANVSATCAVAPRNIAFAVDMSPSMIRETHKYSSVDDQRSTPLISGRSSEFAYFLPEDNNEPTSSTSLQTILSALPSSPSIPILNKFGAVWDWLKTTKTRAQADASPNPPENPSPASLLPDHRKIVHYVDDYVKMKTLNDGEFHPTFRSIHPHPTNSGSAEYVGNIFPGFEPSYFSSPASLWYRVNQLTPPEPLTTTMNSLSGALTAYRNRSVAGDSISFVFFDSLITWPRIFLPIRTTDQLDHVQRIFDFRDGAGTLASPGGEDSDGNEVLDSGRTPYNRNTMPGFFRAIRHQLFPGVTPFGADIKTKTADALVIASTLLRRANPSGSKSQDAVVLITDGKTNCAFRPATATEPELDVCDNSYPAFIQAADRLDQIVQQNFAARGIPVHVILVGNEVGPHTLLRAKDTSVTGPTTDCLTMGDAIEQGIDFVLGGKNGASVSQPNYQPGELTEYADYNGSADMRSQFLFGNSGGVSPFYESNVRAYHIAATTGGIYAPIRPERKRDAGGNCPPVTCTAQPVRLMVDPLCRTLSQQMDDAIQEIIGQVPYSIVDAN